MKKLSKALLATSMSVSLMACSNESSNENTYKIGICNYVDDASLNQIVSNIESRLEEIEKEKDVNFEFEVENCNADSTVLNQIITDFMADDVDLMVAIATPVAMAMQSATEGSDLPVVFSAVSDPVGSKIVDSLEKPGANLTGTSDYLDTTSIFNLIFAADPDADKIGLLYDAFCKNKALCDNDNLVIAGSGQLNIEHKKDEKNVLFINRYIKDSEVAYLYTNARCAVYPYISATQSGVLSLAFYFGVPTVTSDVPFFKSIIEGTGTGVLFETNNVGDLKDKLLNILRTDCSEMRKCQREYYEKNYDGASIRNNLLRIYSMKWTEDCISN